MAELSTTYQAFLDPDLRARVDATVWKEAFNQAGSNAYADNVLTNTAATFITFYWRVAIDYTAAYESALRSGRGSPGHDVDVITDANIAAAVAAAWPPNPTTVP